MRSSACPLHPLIIHVAVVLTPLLAALAVAYALVPRTRRRDWPGRWCCSSGRPWPSSRPRRAARASRRPASPPPTARWAERIASHQSFANPLLLSAALAIGAAARCDSVRVSLGDRFGRPVTLVRLGVTVLLAVVARYFVFRAGDTAEPERSGGA